MIFRSTITALFTGFVVGTGMLVAQTRPAVSTNAPKVAPDAAMSAVVNANTRFSIRLFRHVVTKTPDKNVLLAPTGLSFLLAFLRNGADPEAKREIDALFEFGGMNADEINHGYATLRDELRLVEPFALSAREAEMWGAGKASKPGAPVWAVPEGLLIANSLWLDGGNSSRRDFLELGHATFGSELKQVRAGADLSAAVSRWATKRTGAEIELTSPKLSASDFLLVSITQYGSWWKDEFDRGMTNLDSFHLLNGDPKAVQMMHKQAWFTYQKGKNFQAVKLSTRSNGEMYVILPDEDSSLKELERSLTADTWEQWKQGFAARYGKFSWPRFDIKGDHELGTALQELGMSHAFRSFDAFRPAMPAGARLKDGIGQTMMRVNETRVEAVSVVALGGVLGGIAGGIMQPPPPFEMKVDRPFLIILSDKSTGQFLFVGAVVDP